MFYLVFDSIIPIDLSPRSSRNKTAKPVFMDTFGRNASICTFVRQFNHKYQSFTVCDYLIQSNTKIKRPSYQ